MWDSKHFWMVLFWPGGELRRRSHMTQKETIWPK